MSQPPELRCVFDTNALVSGLLIPNSIPAQALTWAGEQGTILTSLDLLNELRAVLSRPKFDRYLPRDERDIFLASLIRDSALVDITESAADVALSGVAVCSAPGEGVRVLASWGRGRALRQLLELAV